jgi:hypothetical protein
MAVKSKSGGRPNGRLEKFHLHLLHRHVLLDAFASSLRTFSEMSLLNPRTCKPSRALQRPSGVAVDALRSLLCIFQLIGARHQTSDRAYLQAHHKNAEYTDRLVPPTSDVLHCPMLSRTTEVPLPSLTIVAHGHTTLIPSRRPDDPRQHARERRALLDLPPPSPAQRRPLDDIPVPAFGPRMMCTRCGIIGADARPNWKEQPPRESLTGAQWRT